MSANRMGAQKKQVIDVKGMTVTVTRKRVRNINLRIHRDGSIHVSAASHVPLARIEEFVASRESWITQARARVAHQQEVTAASCDEGSTVMLWGHKRTCTLAPPLAGQKSLCSFDACGEALVVHVRDRLSLPTSTASTERAIQLDRWLRNQLRARIDELLPTCEQTVGKRCTQVRIRNMRSRWGSCNVTTGAITLNAQLVHFDPVCLRYVLIHELCHLHEPSHNARFHDLMDRFCPDWRTVRALLNGRIE